jgi:PAN domain
MGPRGASAGLRLGATLVMVLAFAAAPRAADYDLLPEPDVWPEQDDRPDGRKSTWELNTSLTFYRYLEPFPRVDSARACRNRCASHRRCTGWTYYDATFNEAGRYSYRLQGLCVLGAGVKHMQSGNRPGRTSGVLRSARHDGGG